MGRDSGVVLGYVGGEGLWGELGFRRGKEYGMLNEELGLKEGRMGRGDGSEL